MRRFARFCQMRFEDSNRSEAHAPHYAASGDAGARRLYPRRKRPNGHGIEYHGHPEGRAKLPCGWWHLASRLHDGNVGLRHQIHDAGKTCRDGDECQGRQCRYKGKERPDWEGREATGKCLAYSDPCGCFTLVEDGKIMGTLCAD